MVLKNWKSSLGFLSMDRNLLWATVEYASLEVGGLEGIQECVLPWAGRPGTYN